MHYLGISLDKEAFEVVVLDRKKVFVSSHRFALTPEGLKEFYGLSCFQGPVVMTSGFAASDVFVRKLSLPIRSLHKVKKVLPFQLEAVLPVKEEESITCVQMHYVRPETAVTVLSVSRNKLGSLLEKLGIDVDRVSCAQAALFRFVRAEFPDEQRVICFDLRGSKLSCVVVDRNEIVLSQTLAVSDLKAQMESFYFFLKQKEVLSQEVSFLCTGDGSVQEYLLAKEPEAKLLHTPFEREALSMGLALEGSSADRMSVQFCQEELVSEPIFKKRKKQLAIYAMGCLIAAVCVKGGGHLLVQSKKAAICQLLPSQEKHLSMEGIEEALVGWERSLRGKKSPLYLIPNVPKVSEVLAHLSTHPALTTEEGEQREGVDVQSVHYRLTKLPRVGDLNAPYVAQVDVDLKSDTARVARDFHEALLKTDPLVNSKKEIKWHAKDQNYHASFELAKGKRS